MKIDGANRQFPFLSGAGKMGELVAEFDWSATSLGPLAQWSPTVKTTISLAMRSTVPIVMLWGADGVMIYNDAYSVFAGARHPTLLGSKVREGWPEVADFNDNIMRVVLGKGETLAYRDQVLTLHRHGVPEEVWLDLDYSPVINESGEPVGVIAFVTETTELIRAQRWMADERLRMQQMFEQAPGFMAMLSGPDHVFDLTNRAYLQLVGHREVIGKPIRAALPEIEGQGFFELLDTVYRTGEPFIGRDLPARIQRTPGAESEQRFVDLIYQPVRDPGGRVVGIFVEGADVTERVVSERAVRESEAQFRLFAEAMPNHVWTAPPTGLLDWFNTRVYEFSGTKPGDLDGQSWAQIVHPDDVPNAAAAWAESLKSGSPYEVEFRLKRNDGFYRWHIARAVAIRDEVGTVTRWIGTNTDIDDQKRAQDALADSEARLKLAIDAGQLAVWELDAVAMKVQPSAALNRLYGFPTDATPSMADYQSRYAPGEAERLAKIGADLERRGATDLEAEVRHILPGGLEKWYLIRAQSVEGGRRALGVVIDITERKGVEARLLESDRRFRLSQNAAGIASLELDIASGNVIGSDGFWDLWGLTPRDNVHISVLESIVVPEDKDIRSTEATRQTGTAVPNVEYRIRRADTGQLRWLSRNIEFIHDETGRPLKMFGIMQDVTERKEAQARQELLTHELEHRIKNILAMVAAISSQTLKNADLDTAREAFNDRLRALGSAHDILTGTRWADASLAKVVEAAIAPLPPGRIEMSGPAVTITPKMALSLALAVNELGTNSVKYGALSREQGRVKIVWSVAPKEVAQGAGLTWKWMESGGPAVSPPSRRGFGTFLVQRVLAADFGGSVRIEYRPQGVECTLTAPTVGLPALEPT